MNTADGHDRCENCRYFQPNETNGETGDCRRYAPRPLQEGRPLSVLAPWPMVETADWCGEWAPPPTRQTPPVK